MRIDKVSILIILQLVCMTLLVIYNLPLGMYESILFIILFILSIILLMKRFQLINRLKSMDVEIKRSINGNLKTRIFANHDSALNEVIFSLNDLIEKYEQVYIEAIKSQEARKSLLSSISHDIRTPLTSIIGYVDALVDGIATSEAERHEFLEIISKKSNGLKELIDQIFNMAKLDADEIPMKLEIIDLAEMTRGLLIEFLPELKRNQIEFKVNIPDERYTVLADRISILRIISNIVKNALQYGKQGKVLGIDLSVTRAEYQIHIWDRGPGIPKADLENVFERMYRVDPSRNSQIAGSGLGLAISKVLVEKNGGSIWVESIPWEKTTFIVSFPKSKRN
ncbi:sensor histidine kinase [Bacillus sp. CGMCC 1.16607]|uniref:sensor histidine kinase n=1 Tax=Bacillus sp. CGMCC 1.16607 TaxID=3351842 RepID=UPI00362523CC